MQPIISNDECRTLYPKEVCIETGANEALCFLAVAVWLFEKNLKRENLTIAYCIHNIKCILEAEIVRTLKE